MNMMNITNIKRATRSGLAAAVLAVLWGGTAGAAYIQVADSGHVISYTYSQFLNGTGGSIIGQANGYGDDVGFFYDPTVDRYIQVADSGHVVSYSYSQFLNGTGGSIIGQANGYGDDAGFFFVPDPEAMAVSTPPTVVLLGFALAALSAFRRRGPA